jgi:hypothetical protein
MSARATTLSPRRRAADVAAYLAWSLPFAALRTPRAPAPLAVVAWLWRGPAGVPQMPSPLHDIGWYPTRSATGHANHEYEITLVR